jgi:hypothetical protein
LPFYCNNSYTNAPQYYVIRTLLINPLNTELNPICHLLVLLGDLTFMGPCIVSIFQYTCISNKMQHYTVYLYLETVLHVSGGTSTYHQVRIQLYLQYLVFVTPLLLSAAIVEKLEPVWVCCGWRVLSICLSTHKDSNYYISKIIKHRYLQICLIIRLWK